MISHIFRFECPQLRLESIDYTLPNNYIPYSYSDHLPLSYLELLFRRTKHSFVLDPANGSIWKARLSQNGKSRFELTRLIRLVCIA